MTVRMRWKSALQLSGAIALGAALAACDGKLPGLGQPKPQPETRGETPAEIDLKIVEDGAGGFAFSCAGVYTDADCNLDFRAGEAARSAVRISFSIDPGAVEGLRFQKDGAEAMYIALKEQIGETSPKAPYRGEEFSEFKTSDDGLTFSVLNRNADGQVYRYSLRFDLDGELVAYDPDISNGSNE